MASTNLALLNHYKSKLLEIYKTTDLGPVDGHNHSGMHVTNHLEDEIVHISADAKVTAMLRRHGLADAREPLRTRDAGFLPLREEEAHDVTALRHPELPRQLRFPRRQLQARHRYHHLGPSLDSELGRRAARGQ